MATKNGFTLIELLVSISILSTIIIISIPFLSTNITRKNERFSALQLFQSLHTLRFNALQYDTATHIRIDDTSMTQFNGIKNTHKPIPPSVPMSITEQIGFTQNGNSQFAKSIFIGNNRNEKVSLSPGEGLINHRSN